MAQARTGILQWSARVPLNQAPSQAPEASGVYRLYRGGTYLSRGQTENLRRRLRNHADCARRLRCTGVVAEWARVPTASRRMVEQALGLGAGDRREMELLIGDPRISDADKVGGVVRRLGLSLSPGEVRYLMAGQRLPLAGRSIRDVGRFLIRADDFARARRPATGGSSQYETAASAQSCPGCKGLCVKVSGRHCLCIGLFGISYCYIDPLK